MSKTSSLPKRKVYVKRMSPAKSRETELDSLKQQGVIRETKGNMEVLEVIERNPQDLSRHVVDRDRKGLDASSFLKESTVVVLSHLFCSFTF